MPYFQLHNRIYDDIFHKAVLHVHIDTCLHKYFEKKTNFYLLNIDDAINGYFRNNF